MQTKAFIFLFSTVIYLFGLFVYADSRTVADQRLKNNISSMEPAAIEVSNLAHTLDTIVNQTRKVAKIAAPKPVAPVAKAAANPLIVRTIRSYNRDISKADARGLARLIEKTAKRHDVDPLLVTALVSQESAFYQDAVSPVGALGLGQLMPYTAADLGVDPADPADNLEGCVRYLAQNLDHWNHTANPVALALASYNAGPGAVASYGGIPPYEETRNYVKIITRRYNSLRSEHLARKNSSKQHLYG